MERLPISYDKKWIMFNDRSQNALWFRSGKNEVFFIHDKEPQDGIYWAELVYSDEGIDFKNIVTSRNIMICGDLQNDPYFTILDLTKEITIPSIKLRYPDGKVLEFERYIGK